MSPPPRRPKVVFTTFGTHGDLHPFLAVALALKERDVEVVIAAAEMYRDKIEAEGVGFHHMRPDLDVVGSRLRMDQQTIARKVAQRPEFIIEDILLPHLRESFEDVMNATSDADLVVTHSATYGARLAADKRGLPNVAIVLQPMLLMSAHDPPIVATMPRLSRWIYRRGLRLTRAYLALGKRLARNWAKPIEALRHDVGLPPTTEHPLFEGQLRGEAQIALFSPLFGGPQADHPGTLSIVGFAFYDSEAGGHTELSAETDRFIANGPAPYVFTQGTSAVQDADDFIRESLAAIERLNARAVLVLDTERALQWRARATHDVLITGYAPYSRLFPLARVNVHHGGVGTTAQALRAGKPQLIAPYLVDQPDNAARVERLGCGRVLDLKRYRAAAVAEELRLLEHDDFRRRAAAVGNQVAAEHGASAAADIIVEVLNRNRRAS